MSRAVRLSLILLLASTCAQPGAEDPKPASTRRDALPLPIDVTLPLQAGSPLSRFGAFATSCEGNYVVTGEQGLFWNESNMLFFAGAPEVRAPTCMPISSGAVGGPSGIWKYSTGQWLRSIDAGVTSIDRHPSSLLFLLTASNDSAFLFPDGGVSWFASPALDGRWSRDGTQFALVSRTELRLHSWNGATIGQPRVWAPPSGQAFKGAVALGEFNPVAGLEMAAVLESNEVVVFNELEQAPLMRIAFGSTVATDYAYFMTLDALLIGDPMNDRVIRMLGDAGVDVFSTGQASSEFGRSLATKTFGSAIAGAPGWSVNTGAVFELTRNPFVPTGAPQVCEANALCSVPSGVQGVCNYGTCVGGVACTGQTSPCPMGWTCRGDVCVVDGVSVDASVDAGNLDAGFDAGVDAGSVDPVDAGSIDAGSIDAGLNDAGSLDAGPGDGGSMGAKDGGADKDGGIDAKDAGGELQTPPDFTVITCEACSTSGGMPLFLFVLATLVRGRRARLSRPD